MFTANDPPPQKDNIPPVVYCWRCKGSHAPYSCPNYNQFKKPKPPGQSHPQQSYPQQSHPQQSHLQQQHPQSHHSQRPHHRQNHSNQTYPQSFDSSDPQNHSSVNAVTHSAQSPSCVTSHLFVQGLKKFSIPGGSTDTALPRQLKVPLTVRNWTGKAVIDTGSTYTLMNMNMSGTMSKLQIMNLPHGLVTLFTLLMVNPGNPLGGWSLK